MSMGNVRGFYEKVTDDKALQAQLNAIRVHGGADGREEASEVVKIAAAAGYHFTAGDLARALESKPRKLPETELRRIAIDEDCYEGKNYFCNAAYICASTTYH